MGTCQRPRPVIPGAVWVMQMHCEIVFFRGWWKGDAIDPELNRNLLFMLAQEFGELGILSGGKPMEFIAQCIKALKRKHYHPKHSDTHANA